MLFCNIHWSSQCLVASQADLQAKVNFSSAEVAFQHSFFQAPRNARFRREAGSGLTGSGDTSKSRVANEAVSQLRWNAPETMRRTARCE